MGLAHSYLVFSLLDEGDKTKEEIIKGVKKLGFSDEFTLNMIEIELEDHKLWGDSEIKNRKYSISNSIDKPVIRGQIKAFAEGVGEMPDYDKSGNNKRIKRVLEEYLTRQGI